MQEHNYTRNGTVSYEYSYYGGGFSGQIDVIRETFSLDQLVTENNLSKPLLPKPHSYRIRKSVGMNGSYVDYQPSNQFIWKGFLGYTDAQLPVDPYDISTIENEALDSLNQKVRGSLDVSVDAFQLKQTADLLRSLSPNNLHNTAHDIYRRMKFKGKPGNLYDWLKSASGVPADLWLQFQYGWKPTLSTVFDAALESQRHVQKGLSSFDASSMRRADGIDIPAPFGHGGDWEGYKNLRGKWACKYGLVLDCGLTSAERLQRWSSLNPVSIAWELIPYSFVVDWFYDIGGYLRSLESALINDVSFVSGYKSTIVAYEHSPFVEWKGKNVSGYTRTGKMTGSGKYVRFNRQVLSSYPLPNLPRFKTSLGSSQCLSAAALLHQWLPNRIR